ncbi:MAG: hypothetical protein QNJ81_06555 [Acidimicrobiia bacterium]|nr:hypothetical protein [Acidimicrobiia bacterium]
MNNGLTWIISTTLLATGLVLLGLGYIEGASVIFAACGVLVVGAIGKRMATEEDAHWLPQVIVGAYLVKLLASLARFLVLEYIYRGVGDAVGYHGSGNRLVGLWRSFQIPEFDIGTEFVNMATAFLYIPYVPTLLGGFFLFATLAFFGQLMLYAAFRRWAYGKQAGWYAAGVLFLPTIIYWPSSIGKESLMFFFLGMGSLGASRLLDDFRLRWAALFGIGALGAAVIRPHVALLFGGSLAIALLFGRSRSPGLGGRKLAAIALISAVLAVVGAFTAQKFGIDFASGLEATEDFENVLTNVEGSTSKGGSGVTGSGIRTPADFPAGFLKVLFRPFPQEANNEQALASSMEGLLLLGLFAWRFLPMLKNGVRIRRQPYLIFALVFTLGFVVAFSSFNNFGLLARQRSQVMPYFIALIIGLGWAIPDDEAEGATGGSDSLRRHPRSKQQAGRHNGDNDGPAREETHGEGQEDADQRLHRDQRKRRPVRAAR